jgi:uncharacterized membrane protein
VQDIPTVTEFLSNFSESLRSGVLYPRWMGNLFAGAGMPAFVYYSPIAYYISSLLTLPTALDPHNIIQLGLSMGAAITLSGITSYSWIKRHTDRHIASIICFILLLMPSQFLAMHMNISLAQLWASVWVPLGLITIERWRERNDLHFLMGLEILLCVIGGLLSSRYRHGRYLSSAPLRKLALHPDG